MSATMRARSQAGAVAVLLPLLLSSAVATAQEKAAPSKQRVVSVSEVTIVGRVQKPIAAVDVSRIEQKLTVHELKERFLSRVAQALYHRPF